VRLAFGTSFPELDAGMRGYAQREVFAVGEIEFPAAAPVTLPRGRALGRPEALERLARAMFDTGFQPEHLAEVVEAAAGAASRGEIVEKDFSFESCKKVFLVFSIVI